MIVKNIALLGHKDHGKSTLIGSILMQTGSATKVRINEAKMYSKRLGKPFEPAFILDSFAEEREQEMTYDTTRAEIKHKDLAFSFIDVPGHEELIKNMISGASYGEIALLLVSAKKDEGIKDQTKRHLFISRMLGIDKLVVAVNKMDLIGYNEKEFQKIKYGLSEFISKIGFKEENVNFVPISAYKGENLVKKSDKLGWYRGETLIQTIYDYAKTKKRGQSGPLRIIIQGTIDKKNGIIGGKIVSGKLVIGQRISILPNMQNATVKQLIVKGKKARIAETGQNVAVKLDKGIGFELRGTLITEVEDKPVLTDSIKARIFVTDAIGKNLRIKYNGIDIKCNRLKVLDSIDATSGRIDKEGKPKPLNAIDAKLKFNAKLPVEEFEVTKELGRFVLYSNNKFAGIGIIT